MRRTRGSFYLGLQRRGSDRLSPDLKWCFILLVDDRSVMIASNRQRSHGLVDIYIITTTSYRRVYLLFIFFLSLFLVFVLRCCVVLSDSCVSLQVRGETGGKQKLRYIWYHSLRYWETNLLLIYILLSRQSIKFITYEERGIPSPRCILHAY